MSIKLYNIYAEVVTLVAGGLEAGGLPGYPKSLFVELYFTHIMKMRGLKLYTKCLQVEGEKISTPVQVEGLRASPS